MVVLERRVYPLFGQLLFKNVRFVILDGHFLQLGVHLTEPVHKSHFILSKQLGIGQSLMQHVSFPPASLLELYVTGLSGVQSRLNKLLLFHRACSFKHLTQTDSLKQVFTVTHNLLFQALTSGEWKMEKNKQTKNNNTKT